MDICIYVVVYDDIIYMHAQNVRRIMQANPINEKLRGCGIR